jgi:photosystem II stability/assembly factor-like uncharacterized protein
MRLTCMCILLSLLGLGSVAIGDWESIGPEGGPVDFVFQSGTDSNHLYVGCGSSPVRILESTDGGDSWDTAGSCNAYFYSMTIGPTDILWGGAYGSIWKSVNGGQTWTSSSVTSFLPWGLTAHPTDPGIIYAAGYHYVSSNYYPAFARSTNGGSSWTVTDLTTAFGAYGRCVGVSASSPNIIYVSGYTRISPYNPKLWKSTNGGDSFTEIVNTAWNPDYYMYSVAVHPTNPDIVLAGTYYNIWRSTNGGSSWVKAGLNKYANYCLRFSGDDPNVVFSGGSSYIYRSLDAGVSWTNHNSGLGGGPYESVAADWNSTANVFTGCPSGFYQSSNTASSWAPSNTGLLIGNVLAFCSVDCSPYTLYMSAASLGLFRTTDDGDSWEVLGTPLACGDVCAVATPPGNPGTIYALEGTG